MCGRFVAATPPDELARYFGATAGDAVLAASYNVAPTSDVLAVVETDGVRRLEVFHWGLVPPWADDPKIGSRMINARAETLATKSAFRKSLAARRCLVPMDGFYEWKVVAGQKAKQPVFIARADGEPLAVAGLWERWRDRRDPAAPALHSLTVVTTSANATVSPVHDRMPAILAPGTWDRWLAGPGDDLESLTGLLVPAPAGLLIVRPVSTAVNSVRNNGPELLEPVGEAAQLGLGGSL